MLVEQYGEKSALDFFWVHYDEYLNRTFEIIKVAYPEQGRAWKYQVDSVSSKPSYCYLRPYQVQKIKYTDDPGFFIRFLDIMNEEVEQKEYCLNEKALAFNLTGLKLDESDWLDYT